MKIAAHFVVIAFVAGATLALAQTTTPTTTTVVPLSRDDYGNPYGYPYAYRHSSTPAEGYARGMADVIRSKGDFNLSSSAAAINFSNARQHEIENAKLWTKTYFEIRDINKQAFDADQQRRCASPEDWIRYVQAGKPRRLSPSELDAVTGEIHWPMLLATQEYKSQRVDVEKAFADRAYRGIMTAETFLSVLRATEEMLANLRDQVRNLPADKYVLAKRFLQSLAYEASQPAG